MQLRTLLSKLKISRFLVIAAFINVIFQPSAYADMVSTEQLVTQAQTASLKVELKNLMAREDIRTQMINLGVEMSDVQDRIDSMTDAELNLAYAGLEAQPAGGGIAGTVLTVLLIILVLDIAGVTDIFPGV